ncbi:efflux RND transporter periplasmic adaptor subunit [Mongoliimonas terrestris]|uniref:efflux RND transporter periplasmic adaptor subunit n=1 Tax=Mongoliimonas terrestris TaxID=1709001 RepID=UPI0009498303|nr:efflux RND transporter periplasmic adaptor subunit [Mongoliimonas terrestris]
MKKRSAVLVGSVLAVLSAAAAWAVFPLHSAEVAGVADARLDPPIVRLAAPVAVSGLQRDFTGVVAARVQSNLGFRVGGKIVERLVGVGQRVVEGQPLMRIDSVDLRLALAARRNAVTAARAVVLQAEADESRLADLVRNGWTSMQRYEQAKAALDTGKARLAAAEAEARVAENEAAYSVLLADEDGTIVETLAEPGQVVSVGQPVIRLAHAGPREAVVALPETVRPTLGSVADATLFGSEGTRFKAELRQLSDAADSQSRTYEARYVLGGKAANAPLGATVTIEVATDANPENLQVPLGAVLDDGRRMGVWTFDQTTSTVRFSPVRLVRMTDEAAVVTGLRLDDIVVSLGAHLLQDGARVRTLAESGSAQ